MNDDEMSQEPTCKSSFIANSARKIIRKSQERNFKSLGERVFGPNQLVTTTTTTSSKTHSSDALGRVVSPNFWDDTTTYRTGRLLDKTGKSYRPRCKSSPMSNLSMMATGLSAFNESKKCQDIPIPQISMLKIQLNLLRFM